jgi:hypothetical protein
MVRLTAAIGAELGVGSLGQKRGIAPDAKTASRGRDSQAFHVASCDDEGDAVRNVHVKSTK